MNNHETSDSLKKMVVIVYASQTGNAMDAAERIGRDAERRGCPVAVVPIDEFDAVIPNLFTVKLLTLIFV